MNYYHTNSSTGVVLAGAVNDVGVINKLRIDSNAYVLAKLCPEDKEQLDRIEKKLNKKKEYVQLRINK